MQCTLTHRNGQLSLHKPRTKSRPLYSKEDYEWTASDLDEIRVGDLLEELSLLQSKAPSRATRSWHERCYQRRAFAMQYTLSNDHGNVTLQKPGYLLRLYSKALKASDPACRHGSSDSGSRSSSLLLPPELRIEIYRYLLCSRGSIHYPLRRSTHNLRIIPTTHHYGRLDLWPEILATCRRIKWEGAPILHGKNSFRREFQWPRKSCPSKQPWPLLLSCHLSPSRIESITRIELFRDYHLWQSDDAELKVFRDFPSLRHLHIQFDFHDMSPANLPDVWKGALKSASCKQPALNRLSCSMRIAFDNGLSYRDWVSGPSLPDFRPHRMKKTQLEAWMKQEDIFIGSHFVWGFETIVLEQVGFEDYVRFVVDETCKKAPEDGVRCVMRKWWDDEEISIEPS